MQLIDVAGIVLEYYLDFKYQIWQPKKETYAVIAEMRIFKKKIVSFSDELNNISSISLTIVIF